LSPLRTDRHTEGLAAWYHITRRECCYGDLISPETETCTDDYVQSVRYFCPIWPKFGFSRYIFIKAPSIKFHGNPCTWSRAYKCERTDGRAGGRTWRSEQARFETRRTRWNSNHKDHYLLGCNTM
jgi:hypothetical protein